MNDENTPPAPHRVHVVVPLALIGVATLVDYSTGLHYRPGLLYSAAVLYGVWRLSVPCAVAMLLFAFAGMTVSALADPTFYLDGLYILDLVTRLTSAALLTGVSIGLKINIRRRLDDQRRRIDEQMRRSEDQRRFVVTLSHEVRTPLSVISGQSQRFAATAADIAPEKIRQRAESVLNAVAKIRRFVDMFLMNERLESGQIVRRAECLDIEVLVRRVCRQLGETCPSAAIVVAANRPPAVMVGDTQLIECVVENLISNALKYSVAGSPPRVEVSVAGRGNEVVIAVRDWGPGIPADDLPHIFNRFYRGKNVAAAGGFGIGLHSAKAIADIHGGRIDVAPAPDTGTCFVVTLPVAGNGDSAREVA